MLHHWHKLSLQAGYFIVFISWYNPTFWWHHEQLTGHTTSLVQSITSLSTLFPFCYMQRSTTMASTDPQVRKQGTGLKEKLRYFNDST